MNQIHNLALRRGWVVPAHDKHVLQRSLADVRSLPAIIDMCSLRRTAVQAGGNIGIWVTQIASKFKRCITFEPDPQNFSALQINTSEIANVERLNAAIGSRPGRTGLKRVEGNAGAHFCCEGCDVAMMCIDDLQVEDCDFIQLDVEGMNHAALLGAEKTIRRTWPLIMVEMNGLGTRFGVKDDDTRELLKSWGYKEEMSIGRDVVFKHFSKALTPPIAANEPCVIVGNGPSACGRKLGRVIDSFDYVVRINGYKLQSYEKFIGSKTTLHATHGKLGGRSAEPPPEKVLWLHEHAAWHTPMSWHVTKHFYWSLVATWSNNKSILPSAGLVTVAWLLDQGVSQVHLVGFDHFLKSGSKAHHYWDERAMSQPREHAPEREAALFAEWEKRGRVRYL